MGKISLEEAEIARRAVGPSFKLEGWGWVSAETFISGIATLSFTLYISANRLLPRCPYFGIPGSIKIIVGGYYELPHPITSR